RGRRSVARAPSRRPTQLAIPIGGQLVELCNVRWGVLGEVEAAEEGERGEGGEGVEGRSAGGVGRGELKRADEHESRRDAEQERDAALENEKGGYRVMYDSEHF